MGNRYVGIRRKQVKKVIVGGHKKRHLHKSRHKGKDINTQAVAELASKYGMTSSIVSAKTG